MSRADGWQRIVKLNDGSPLQAAGAAVGDSVRFQRHGESWLRHFGTDERIEVELQAASGMRTATLVRVPNPRPSPSLYVLGYVSTWLARWLSLLIGALLGMATRRQPSHPRIGSIPVLGAAAGYSLPSGALREENVVWHAPFLEDIAGMGGPWFALQVQEDRPIWKMKSVTLLILAFSTLIVVSLIRWALQWRLGYDAALWYSVPGLEWLSGSRGYSSMWAAIDIASVAALLWSWRRSKGEVASEIRTRR